MRKWEVVVPLGWRRRRRVRCWLLSSGTVSAEDIWLLSELGCVGRLLLLLSVVVPEGGRNANPTELGGG